MIRSKARSFCLAKRLRALIKPSHRLSATAFALCKTIAAVEKSQFFYLLPKKSASVATPVCETHLPSSLYTCFEDQ
jgi:hypothetical protein